MFHSFRYIFDNECPIFFVGEKSEISKNVLSKKNSHRSANNANRGKALLVILAPLAYGRLRLCDGVSRTNEC